MASWEVVAQLLELQPNSEPSWPFRGEPEALLTQFRSGNPRTQYYIGTKLLTLPTSDFLWQCIRSLEPKQLINLVRNEFEHGRVSLVNAIVAAGVDTRDWAAHLNVLGILYLLNQGLPSHPEVLETALHFLTEHRLATGAPIAIALILRTLPMSAIRFDLLLNQINYGEVDSYFEHDLQKLLDTFSEISITNAATAAWLLDHNYRFEGRYALYTLMLAYQTRHVDQLIQRGTDLSYAFPRIASTSTGAIYIPRLLQAGINPFDFLEELIEHAEAPPHFTRVLEMLQSQNRSSEINAYPIFIARIAFQGPSNCLNQILAIGLTPANATLALLEMIPTYERARIMYSFQTFEAEKYLEIGRQLLEMGADPQFENSRALNDLLYLLPQEPPLYHLAEVLIVAGAQINAEILIQALHRKASALVQFITARIDWSRISQIEMALCMSLLRRTRWNLGLYSSIYQPDLPASSLFPVEVEVGDLPQRSWEDGFVAFHGTNRLKYFYAVYDGHGQSHQLYCRGDHQEREYLWNKLHVVYGAIKGHQFDSGAKLYPLHFYLEWALQATFEAEPGESQVATTVSAGIQAGLLSFEAAALHLGFRGGTTITGILKWDDQAYMFNLGDSRTIIYVGTEILYVSRDHDPADPEEANRIKARGGILLNGRIEGSNFSRSLLDPHHKQSRRRKYDPLASRVTTEVEVTPILIPASIDPTTVRALLTSDAPFTKKKFTSEALVELAQTLTASEIAEVIQPTTNDDITVMIVPVHPECYTR